MGKEESIIKLSDEFKRDLRRKIKVNWPAITGLTILIIVIFTSLGIGTYQIFFKPEKAETTVTNEEKIQSRPKEEAKQTQPAATTTAPATASTTKPATKPAYETYTIQEGDTLSGIASKYNTTSKAIADFNGWTDPEQTLQIGQKIKIPQ